MIDISNIYVFGWEMAFKGMRNSFASWDKSDSEFERGMIVTLGPNDLELASRLAKCGGSEAKFRRMIHIQCDILAPLYWWKQFDTYKVGTVELSTSTMHSITKKEFTIDDFSHGESGILSPVMGIQLLSTVNSLNELRTLYLNEDNAKFKKMYFDDIIQLLPEGYNQLRTVDMNYEVVAHMVNDRLYHKLDEWHEFCRKMLANLPYAKELILNIEVTKDE